MKYKKKPVVIEAHPWEPNQNGSNRKRWPRTRAWAVAKKWKVSPISLQLFIPTKEGTMKASPGDYIIKGIKGEFYPCKPDIFYATYEPTSETGGGERG